MGLHLPDTCWLAFSHVACTLHWVVRPSCSEDSANLLSAKRRGVKFAKKQTSDGACSRDYIPDILFRSIHSLACKRRCISCWLDLLHLSKYLARDCVRSSFLQTFAIEQVAWWDILQHEAYVAPFLGIHCCSDLRSNRYCTSNQFDYHKREKFFFWVWAGDPLADNDCNGLL